MLYANQIDDIDKKLLELLSQNARMSLVELAKQVGLSRVAVKMRMQALEERGVIEKYSVILNPEAMGNAVSVFLDAAVSAEHMNDACKILVDTDEIIKLYQMTGDSRLHIHALLPGTGDLEDFLKNVIYTLPGLVQVSCHTIVSRLKDNKEIRI